MKKLEIDEMFCHVLSKKSPQQRVRTSHRATHPDISFCQTLVSLGADDGDDDENNERPLKGRVLLIRLLRRVSERTGTCRVHDATYPIFHVEVDRFSMDCGSSNIDSYLDWLIVSEANPEQVSRLTLQAQSQSKEILMDPQFRPDLRHRYGNYLASLRVPHYRVITSGFA